MSTERAANVELGPELIGYTDRFSVAPGEQMTFMVSSDLPVAEARLVRLFHGDERSPIGLVEHEIDSSLDASWELTKQLSHTGSFALVETAGELLGNRQQLSGHLFVWPTLTTKTEAQGLLSHLHADRAPGWELVLENGGQLVLRIFSPAGEGRLCLTEPLRERVWHSVAFAIDFDTSTADLWGTPLSGLQAGRSSYASGPIPTVAPRPSGVLLLAARGLADCPGEPRATGCFNGKLERPVLLEGLLDDTAVDRLVTDEGPSTISSLLVDLDLGAESSGWAIRDCSRHHHRARVFNAPLRASTSHSWRGTATDPAVVPGDYRAIWFHDDDIHHANWQPTQSWTIPADLPSGVYAVRLRGDRAEDRIPFIVRPPRDQATNKVALLLSTYTYAAYANERDPSNFWSFNGYMGENDAGNYLMFQHPEWGGSAYDAHPDGSGITISSLLRPVPYIRPTYRCPTVKAPRHFPADLYLVQWLEHLGVGVDVIGDEDVHADGMELLERYRTVITGSHPEYWTTPMLDAIDDYVNSGGRLMYMGGNGFYWVTTVAPEPGVVVEVRRGEAGTRMWNATSGEYHHQFTGELGGLWRYRGRGPHALLGIGFVAEGWDGCNRPYFRQPDSFLAEAAWAFEGIGADEIVGDTGLVMGGAAGDELDSADRALGTPEETLMLASSRDHTDAYWEVIENVLFNRPGLSGTQNPRVRADITLTPKRNAGAVFSVGSISFTGSLSDREYNNPVARLTENVLRAFASDGAPWLADASSADTAGAAATRGRAKRSAQTSAR